MELFRRIIVEVVVRRKVAWLKMLALFALVLAQVPMSVLASVGRPACKMQCCAVRSEVAPPKSRGCSECAKQAAPKHNWSVHGESCKCELSSPSQPIDPLVALGSTQQTSLGQLDAVLKSAIIAVSRLNRFCPDPVIFGADSEPPVSRPNCVWQGRAPPVLLA